MNILQAPSDKIISLYVGAHKHLDKENVLIAVVEKSNGLVGRITPVWSTGWGEEHRLVDTKDAIDWTIGITDLYTLRQII